MGAVKRVALALAVLMVSTAALGANAGAESPAENQITRANIYVQETWPDEFAGYWLDFDYPRSKVDYDGPGYGPDQKVFIAFTSGAEEKVAKVRELFPGTNPFVAVTHKYSMNELENLQHRVTGDLRSYADGKLDIPGPGFKWHATGIRVVDNLVEANLSKVTPEYEAWAAERYAPMSDALSIFVGGKPVPTFGGKRPLRPGLDAECRSKCRKAKARKQALRKKCRRASRVAARTGSPSAKRLARSKKCRSLRRTV